MLTTVLDLNQLQVLLQVTISMLLGAIIGFEREVADRPAGLRTHMLVAAAATLFVVLGTSLVEHYEAIIDPVYLRSDPIRIIEAVITGISFLGAGTIIRRQNSSSVEGLTTAASILLAAAIGICAALNLWILAAGITLLTLLTLRVLHLINRRIPHNRE